MKILSVYPPAPLLQATRLVESAEVFLKSVSSEVGNFRTTVF